MFAMSYLFFERLTKHVKSEIVLFNKLASYLRYTTSFVIQMLNYDNNVIGVFKV